MHISKTFSLCKGAPCWHKPGSEALFIADNVDLLKYVGWNGRALYCPDKELNILSGREPQLKINFKPAPLEHFV